MLDYITGSIREVAQWREHRSYKSGAVYNGIHGFESHLLYHRRIATGYGTGCAATAKSILLRKAYELAVRQAVSQASFRRRVQEERKPAPLPRPNPALDNWIMK